MYKRIQELCEMNNISFVKLCESIGIPGSTLHELSSGRTKSLSSKNLLKIANHFNVSVDYLLEKSNIKNPEALNSMGLTQEELDIISMYRDLSPEIQDAVLRIIRR